MCYLSFSYKKLVLESDNNKSFRIAYGIMNLVKFMYDKSTIIMFLRFFFSFIYKISCIFFYFLSITLRIYQIKISGFVTYLVSIVL